MVGGGILLAVKRMKTFILIGQDKFEGETLLGVYSSRERARRAYQRRTDHFDYWYIVESVVDSGELSDYNHEI